VLSTVRPKVHGNPQPDKEFHTMPTKSVELPRPTPYLVASYVETFNQKQAVVERALKKLFTLFLENIELEHVLIKVVALNDLYRTGILATLSCRTCFSSQH
jgi:hypothetical protein